MLFVERHLLALCYKSESFPNRILFYIKTQMMHNAMYLNAMQSQMAQPAPPS